MVEVAVATNGSSETREVSKELAVPETMLFMPSAPVGLAEEFREVASMILTATALANRLNFKAEMKPAAKLSPKAKKIKRYIELSDFNCRRETVAGLMSMLLDEEIVVKETSDVTVRWVLGAVYVPTDRGNDHNYPTDEPMVYLGEDRRGFRLDGTKGNHCGYYTRNYRKATHEDLAKVFSSEKTLKAVETHILKGGSD